METDELKQDLDKRYPLPRDYDIEFQKWLQSNNYAMASIKIYHIRLVELLAVRKEHPETKKLTIIGWRAYLTKRMIKNYLYSKKGSHQVRAFIKNFKEYLEEKHGILITEIRFPRVSKSSKPLETLTKDEIEKILPYLDNFTKVFVVISYYGGLRISETAKLRVEDFNWQQWMSNKESYGEVKILFSKRNKSRIVPLPPLVMRLVYQFAPKDEEGYLVRGILFNYRNGKRGSKKNFKGYKDFDFYIRKKIIRDKMTKEMAERRYYSKVIRLIQLRLAQIPKSVLDKHIKSHMLRASRATHLDEKGLPPSSIQYLLGHDSLNTTSRYIINTPEKLRRNIERVEKIDETKG